MKGLRQAALCLHGLNEQDRKWLLKQLPPMHRNALKQMLRELNEIGVPQGQSWVPTVKQRIEEHDPGEHFSDTALRMLKIIDSASLSQIKQVLLDEPETVLGFIFSIYKWSWTEEVLGALNVKKRKAVEQVIQRNTVGDLSKNVVETVLGIVFEKMQGKLNRDHKNTDKDKLNGRTALFLGGN